MLKATEQAREHVIEYMSAQALEEIVLFDPKVCSEQVHAVRHDTGATVTVEWGVAGSRLRPTIMGIVQSRAAAAATPLRLSFSYCKYCFSSAAACTNRERTAGSSAKLFSKPKSWIIPS
jgi:hypothetical protein